jgi:glycosyltransferase A (GT-A) superfamily protein (DUF2064 family)
VSKTRLARGVGPEAAARLAAAFIRDTVDAIAATPGLEPVLATTDTAWDFGVDARRVDQGGGDLGARLDRVLRAGIARSGAAFAVGADSPGIPTSLLAGALDALEANPAAFVPTEDGGFAVMAVRTLPDGALADIPWSARTTLSAVEARFASEGGATRLPEWFDIDEASDLERFRVQVPRDRAPHTWAVLDIL